MSLRVLLGPRATVPILAGAVGLMWGWVFLVDANPESAYWALLPLALLLGFAAAQGLRFRRRALAACLAASPLVLKPTQWVCEAAADYRQGGAEIVAHRGLLYAEPYDAIDPRTRIPVRTITTGCMGASPDSLVVHGVRNTTLRILTGVFGPMDGVYTGPLPTVIEWRRRFAQEGVLTDVPVDHRDYRDLDLVVARLVYHDAGLHAHQVCHRTDDDQIGCTIDVIRDGDGVISRFTHWAEPFDAL